MKLSLIATIGCSLTAGGKLGFANATGVLVEGGSNPHVWLGQDDESSETPAPVEQALNCSTIEEIWETDPNLFLGTEYAEIKDKCESGEITTAEEVAAEVEEVLSPNLSIDEQISSIANEICEGLSSGNETDVDASAVEAACSTEPRDDEAVVDAASVLQAENTPKDEEWEAELEETCTSIRANRDKIEAALLVLAASSSERRLQDDPDSEAPVTSFEMATDLLSMYDCFCDQSNPDNLGCTKKTLKFTEVVSKSIEEQAAIDVDPERILNDVEETIEKHTHYLRHSGHDDNNDTTLSLARALSEVHESVGVSSSVGECDPPGITPTPQNDGYKLCLYAGPIFECEVNWSPHSAGCVAFECGAGEVLQMVGSVQVCYPGPVIHLELKLCVSVISEIIERIGTWVPSVEKFFNKFNIYSGCYRLAIATYNVPHNRFEVVVPTQKAGIANLDVYAGSRAYMRFKNSGCAYHDDLTWWTYELAAKDAGNGAQVHPDWNGAKKSFNPNSCPFNSGRWAIFQLYFKIVLDLWLKKKTLYSFDKYYISK